MPRTIGTCLWFENEAEQAAEFYMTVFDDSRILDVSRFEGAPGPEGQAVAVEFELEGRAFTALNGARGAIFTEAVSFMVLCEDQETVDRYWTALADGGSESQCGWLKDRFGVSWQIIPSVLNSLIAGPDPLGSQRAMQAMLGMRKLDIAALQQAYDG
jgi:predicted 3-demethylubiquinone-9 3-methyltransferase (glyoxalase superfamily)